METYMEQICGSLCKSGTNRPTFWGAVCARLFTFDTCLFHVRLPKTDYVCARCVRFFGPPPRSSRRRPRGRRGRLGTDTSRSAHVGHKSFAVFPRDDGAAAAILTDTSGTNTMILTEAYMEQTAVKWTRSGTNSSPKSRAICARLGFFTTYLFHVRPDF